MWFGGCGSGYSDPMPSWIVGRLTPWRARRNIRRAARSMLGHATLRPGQAEAIASVLRRDTLVVLQSGGGKSAIYQVAGGMTPGPTVVVSPMLALQRDQLDAIGARIAAGKMFTFSIEG